MRYYKPMPTSSTSESSFDIQARSGVIASFFRSWAPLLVLTFAMVWPLTIHFRGLPSALRYVPDLMLAIVVPILVVRLVANRGWARVNAVYYFVFFSFLYVVFSGALLNGVSGDTLFVGARLYFRYLPVFLLPFAFSFSERDYKFQLGFIALVLFLQLPITVWQRFFLYSDLFTGDSTSGSFTSTSSLTLVCCGGVLYLIAALLCGQLKALLVAFLSAVFIFSLSLAETKATPIFLGLGLAVVLFTFRQRLDMAKLMGIGLSSMALLGAFVLVYDRLYSREDGAGYVELMTDSDRMMGGYNFRGVEALPVSIPIKKRGDLVAKDTPELVGDAVEVGRFDSMRIPFTALYPDELTYLLIGLGVGNMDSNFGSGGDYNSIEHYLGGTIVTVSHLIWETGVLGFAFFVLFLVIVTAHMYRVAQIADGWLKMVAAAQCAFGAVIILSLTYANLLHVPEVLMLFVYFCGVVMSVHRQRMAENQPEALKAILVR